MSTEDPEVERLRKELEQEWAKTWQTDNGEPPTPEELRAHPRYQLIFNAWLEGHGLKPPTS